MYPSQLLKGTFQIIILKLLKEHNRMYGYEISQKVKEVSDGAILLPEGSLYPILHKLTEEGLLKMEKEHVGKRVRRYYSLTKTGAAEAKFKIEEFDRFIFTMRQLLSFKLTKSET